MDLPSNEVVVTLCDGDVTVWVDNESSIHLKCVTRFGDPVELSSVEAEELSDVLRRLAERIR